MMVVARNADAAAWLAAAFAGKARQVRGRGSGGREGGGEGGYRRTRGVLQQIGRGWWSASG